MSMQIIGIHIVRMWMYWLLIISNELKSMKTEQRTNCSDRNHHNCKQESIVKTIVGRLSRAWLFILIGVEVTTKWSVELLNSASVDCSTYNLKLIFYNLNRDGAAKWRTKRGQQSLFRIAFASRRKLILKNAPVYNQIHDWNQSHGHTNTLYLAQHIIQPQWRWRSSTEFLRNNRGREWNSHQCIKTEFEKVCLSIHTIFMWLYSCSPNP